LTPCDPEFPARAKENSGGFIVGGSNYGQGSSREHAALAPLQLGIKAVVVKSFARIHMANLINSGILPLTFKDENDFEKISNGDVLKIEDVRNQIKNGNVLVLKNNTKNVDIYVEITLSDRQKQIMLAGGLLNYTRQQSK